MKQKVACLLLLPGLLTGCAVGPDYVRPAQQDEIPAQWTDRAASRETRPLADALPTTSAALVDSQATGRLSWWTAFGDTTLNSLIEDALVYNNDLALAAARVLEADALLGGSRAARWPAIEVGGTASRAKSSRPALQFPIPTYNNSFNAQATLRYEFDLWGRLSRGREAALATLLASRENQRAVAQRLIADVARTWLEIRELHLQVALTQRTINSFRSSLTTVENRYRRGLVSALDVRLARQSLANAEAGEPRFNQQLSAAKRRLEILVGRYPAGNILASDLDTSGGYLAREVMPRPLPAIPTGLPSQLLDRRPDLQAAELQLHAAVARVGEAKAALFPRISLTAAAGSASQELSDLFTSPANTWSLAGNLFMPLLNRGATQAQIKAAAARADQGVATYRKAVLGAFGEVENALDQDVYQARQESFLTDSVEQARRAVDLAQDRYQRGLDNLLVTLESQRRLFNAESLLLTTQRTRRAARINLIQALGGPWEPVLAAVAARQTTRNPAEGAQP